jgi:aspartyl aminopeptidase
MADRFAVAFALAVVVLPMPLRAEEPRLGHRATVWQHPTAKRYRKPAWQFARDYRRFLGAHKTVREVAAAALALARARGFRHDLFGTASVALRPGSRAYALVHGKLAAFVLVGQRPLRDGVHLIAGHIDAVRIDLKQRPLYADGNLALLETHYYGGIKKYQWLSRPLELRGVVAQPGGKLVRVAIGDQPDEPVLVIPDLAAHVSGQVTDREGEAIPGEKLDAILSSTAPAQPADAGQDPFAAEAARLLKTHYNLDLADLATAELELVPADPPRDVGIDGALIGGYGQDDRACSYAALRALLDLDRAGHTAIVMLVDNEEIGSSGNTGAGSTFVRRVVAELLASAGQPATEVEVDRVLGASMVFSADVSGAVHPQYRELYDPANNAFLGAGVIWDRSAIHAEVMAYVRDLFDRAGVVHQPATWTKVGSSSGGTVLPYFTRHGMNGLDVSIPLLSMHAPYELISKADLYEAYRAYQAFLRD